MSHAQPRRTTNPAGPGRPRRVRGLVATAVLLAAVAPPTALAQSASFRGLGEEPFDLHYGLGISRDGVTASGVTLLSTDGGIASAYTWTESAGMTLLPDLPGGPDVAQADAVADNGIAVGRGIADVFQRACRWVGGTPADLGVLGSFEETEYSMAWDVSNDGTRVVGQSSSPSGLNEAFLWEEGVGMIGLGDLPGGSFASIAYAISADGAVVVGFGTSDGGAEAFRYADGVMIGLGAAEGDTSSRALGISPNGAVIVGHTNERACTWIDGAVTVLGVVDGCTRSFATASSENGTVIVGDSFCGGAPRAFLWTLDGGMRDLKEVLELDHGLDLAGWTLEEANGISADGTRIVGNGRNPDGRIEGWLAVLPPVDADTDGDGLLDAWETDGIDVDGDGVVDLDLPALGARPDHKTLFIEVDEMECALMPHQVKQRVEQAFANAEGVENPDGLPGIDLIIVKDEDDLPCVSPWPIDADLEWPLDFDVQKDLYFGTPQERAHESAEALLAAKRKVFRYCIYGYRLETPKGDTDTMGVARAIPGNDFIMASDTFTEDLCPGQTCDAVDYEAAVFMHELGHCLGLKHGGDVHDNYKPNYVSVMNYLESFPYEQGDATWRLDYSQGNMFPLDESQLDEEVGLYDPTGRNEGVVTYFGRAECPADPCAGEARPVTLRAIPITNGQWVDFNGDGLFESGVCADLNYFGPDSDVAKVPSPCQVLRDHDDWGNLHLALVDEGAHPGGGGEGVTGEPTVALVQALHAELPASCPADVDGSTIVDFDDLLAVLARWGETTGHPADVNADGTIDFDDLLLVLGAWGPCPA